MNELTDTERKQVFDRITDLSVQAYNLFMELNYLRSEFCIHDYSKYHPESDMTQCSYCSTVCKHERVGIKTHLCEDCGQEVK